jgi:hypothetical protein
MSISTCSEEIGRRGTRPNESTFLCPVFVLLFIPHILKHAQGAERFISGLESLDDLPDNLSTMGNATETNSSFLKCVNFLFKKGFSYCDWFRPDTHTELVGGD